MAYRIIIDRDALQRLRRLRRHRPRRPSRWATTASSSSSRRPPTGPRRWRPRGPARWRRSGSWTTPARRSSEVTEIDVLIAGAGLAGSRCAETLRAGGFGGRVVVAGDEPHAPYERPALSKEMLTGARAPGDLALRDVGFWKDRGIELRLGEALGDIDLRATPRRSSAASRCAGGISCWRPARGPRASALVPAAANVHHLRGLDDAQALRADLERGGRLVIVGSGFVGAEVASSALALGVEVSMVEALPLPFAATLGPAVGRRLADHYRAEGVDLRLGVGRGRGRRARGPGGERRARRRDPTALRRPPGRGRHATVRRDPRSPSSAGRRRGRADRRRRARRTPPGSTPAATSPARGAPSWGATSGSSTGPPPRRAARPWPARSWVRHPRPPRRRTSGRTSSGGGSR